MLNFKFYKYDNMFVTTLWIILLLGTWKLLNLFALEDITATKPKSIVSCLLILIFWTLFVIFFGFGHFCQIPCRLQSTYQHH